MTTAYIMVAALTANPASHVYWSSLNTPDFEGIFSGYAPAQLILPATIDYTLETPVIGTGNVIPQGVAGGDLFGTYPNPSVIKIQGRAISPAAPSNGAPLTWNALTSQWTPGSTSGGGSLLPPVSNQQFAALIENPAGTPVFSRLTFDMILPTYVISLSGGGALQVNQTIANPGFTASYNRAPSTAVLTDSDGNPPQNVITSPNSFNSVNSYTKNTFGATETFTLTSTDVYGFSKTATAGYTWMQLSMFGVGPAGGNSAAFIQALSGQFLTTSRGTTFSVTAGGTQYIYFACRAAYGTPTFIVGGFAGGFSLVSNTISVTNAFGFTENYQLWVSDNAGLGLTTVTVQ